LTRVPSILVIGTLDTKGVEIGYVAGRVRDLGARVWILDSGILGEPLSVTPEISHAEVAEAAGTTLEAVRDAGSRGAAVEVMCRGAAAIARRLFAAGDLDAAICLGGAEGAVIGAAAMLVLPVGIPKIIVTPIASGARRFGPLTGTKDVTVMHSVVDILGINPVSRQIFDSAAAAIGAMAYTRVGHQETLKHTGKQRPLVGITMLGNTTTGVMRVRDRLSEAGFDAVIYHANGVGGPAMEEMTETGMFAGIIDYTTDELSDQLIGGFHAGGALRLEHSGVRGLPRVVVPGCMDFTVQGRRESLPPRFDGRPVYFQNPEFTLVRVLRDEMEALGRIMAHKLNRATGPVNVVVPTRGLSIPNTPDGPFWDPEADRALVASLQHDLRPDIPVILVDAHINDDAFADRVSELSVAILRS